jgi:hypothetical protein
MTEKTLHIKKMRSFSALPVAAAVGEAEALPARGREVAALAGVGQSARGPMPAEAAPRPRQGGFGQGRAPAQARANEPLRDRLALAFIAACEKGDESAAISAITQGLKVHAFGKDLLQSACANGMAEALEALMARGLKPHGFAGNAFGAALAKSHWPICERLLEAGFAPKACRGAWADAFKGLAPREQAEAKRRLGPLDLWIGMVGSAQPARAPRQNPRAEQRREWTEAELERMDAQVSPQRVNEILWAAADAVPAEAPAAWSAWAEWEEQAQARGLSGAALEEALDQAAIERAHRVASSQKRVQALDDETLDRLASLQLQARSQRDKLAETASLSGAEIDRLDREAVRQAQSLDLPDYSVAGYTAFMELIERQNRSQQKLTQDARNAAHHVSLPFASLR